MLIITNETLPNFILLSVRLLVVKSSSISGCLWIPGCYTSLLWLHLAVIALDVSAITRRSGHAAADRHLTVVEGLCYIISGEILHPWFCFPIHSA
jgi:hypothetical protein